MLQAFREAAKSRNLCDKYSELWDGCNTKKQLFDLATDSNGIPYICEAMVDGWGVTPEFISENFKTFINGRYTSQHHGYTSAMYVERFFIEPIVASTTNLIVMACYRDSRERYLQSLHCKQRCCVVWLWRLLRQNIRRKHNKI